MTEEWPRFQPHRLLVGGHLQTLALAFVPPRMAEGDARQIEIRLPDGDAIILHDNAPPGWNRGDRAALLIHGLAGSHASPYMRQVSAKLQARGVRTFRLDLRGCGAGLKLARLPYHSGRSEDAAAALAEIASRCPDSPLSIVGFSLGGNITLKLLGELGAGLRDDPANGALVSGVGICPPVDLAACAVGLQRPLNRLLYDRYFVRMLTRQVLARRQWFPDAPGESLRPAPRCLWDFDNRYTAPVSGMGTAENYYRLCSSNQFLKHVRVPTLLLAAKNDPLIPWTTVASAELSPHVERVFTDQGGHVGYLAQSKGNDADRRWLDWRIVDWVVAH